MCSSHYILSDAAIKVAEAQFELRQLLCEYSDLAQKRYALGMLRARGDTRAERVLLDCCPELQEQVEQPPLGIAAE